MIRLAARRAAVSPCSAWTFPNNQYRGFALSSDEAENAPKWDEFLDSPSPSTLPEETPPTSEQPPTADPLATSAATSKLARKEKGQQKNKERPRRAYFRMHCKASPNNTITSFTTPSGGAIEIWSGGKVGFKKGNRETYEAGYQCAVRTFQAAERMAKEMNEKREQYISEKKVKEADEAKFGIEIFLKGFGQGREAFKSALLTAEGEKIRQYVHSIQDRTPIKIGGTRSKKMPRK